MTRDNQRTRRQKSRRGYLKNSLIIRGFIWLLGITISAFVAVNIKSFTEAFFPKVYVTEEYGMMDHMPICHLLADPANTHISAAFNESMPIQFSVENDNASTIKIDEADLRIIEFAPISEEDYLLLRPWFSQGAAPVIPVGIDAKVDHHQKAAYRLNIINEEDGKTDYSKFVEAFSGETVVFSCDIGFTESGIYTYDLSVKYKIHGKKHTAESTENRILYIAKDIETHKNVLKDGFEDQLIEKVGEQYKLYANGNAVIAGVNEKNFEGFFYNFHSKLINSVTVPSGVETINGYYFADYIYNPDRIHIHQLYLPKTLKEIKEGTFGDHFYVDQIIYEGSETDWNKIIIGPENIDLKRFLVFEQSD